MILAMIAFAAAQAAPVIPCTPTRAAPVCAYQSGPRGITLKVLISSDQVRCGQVRYLGPRDRAPAIRSFQPRSPFATLTFGAPDKGRYTFLVSLQVARRGSNSCPVPFNFGGGAADVLVR